MVSSLPGQSVALCGQPSQVASCFSHSAGNEKPNSAGLCLFCNNFLSIRSAKDKRSDQKVHALRAVLASRFSGGAPTPAKSMAQTTEDGAAFCRDHRLRSMAVTIPRGVFGVASFEKQSRLFVTLFYQIMKQRGIGPARQFARE